MAIKSKHYTILAVGACAAFALAKLPPGEYVEDFAFSLRSSALGIAREKANAQARLAVRDLHDIVLRDSVTSVLESLPASEKSGPVMIIDPQLGGSQRVVAERLLARSWKSFRVDSVRVPVAMVVLNSALSRGTDSAYIPRSGQSYIVPLAGDKPGAPCISIYRLQLDTSFTAKDAAEAFTSGGSRDEDSVYGPCPFYAHFGRPGPAIEEWLVQRGFNVALNAAWNNEPRLYHHFANTIMASLSYGTDYQFTSTDGRRCWLGDYERCEQTITGSLSQQGGTRRLPGMFNYRGVVDRHWDDMSTSFLSDIIRKFGPEKFEAFWRSNESPALAFRSATGMEIGEYTHQWVKWRKGHTVAGARVPAGNIGWSFVIALGCLSVAMVVASRRSSE